MNRGISFEEVEEIFKQIIKLYRTKSKDYTEELKRVIEMIWSSDIEKVIKSWEELFSEGLPTEKEFLNLLAKTTRWFSFVDKHNQNRLFVLIIYLV